MEQNWDLRKLREANLFMAKEKKYVQLVVMSCLTSTQFCCLSIDHVLILQEVTVFVFYLFVFYRRHLRKSCLSTETVEKVLITVLTLSHTFNFEARCWKSLRSCFLVGAALLYQSSGSPIWLRQRKPSWLTFLSGHRTLPGTKSWSSLISCLLATGSLKQCVFFCPVK